MKACSATMRAVAFGLAFLGAHALAQTPPHGPAEVIGQARQAREQRELRQAGARGQSAGATVNPHAGMALPHGDMGPTENPHAGLGIPPPNPHAGMNGTEAGGEDRGGETPENPHAGMASPHGDTGDGAANPHAGMSMGPQGEPPPIARENADMTLPAGTIRVRVVDASGAPAPNAEVDLGIMSADSTRSSRSTHTGADGVATFSSLAFGERQAYRVNVPYQGAKYSSTPFRLPPRGGYEVEIRRLPVTHDDRMVVLYLGATSLELKDDRIKVVQEAQLLNLGGATYVFPEGGALVGLPKGFMAVQSQDSMTDQHIVEAPGEGLRVHGSLPPGQAELLWGFDLPLAGSEASFGIEIPWLTFAYRVIVDAPSGMTVEVADMPAPTMHADSGRKFWVTEMQRKVGDPPFRRLHIALHGIPGPGPERFIAAALALVAVGLGVAFSRRSPKTVVGAPDAGLEARKKELLARAQELHARKQAGDIGPEYHAEQMRELTDELAAVLFEQAELRAASRRAPRSVARAS